MRQARPPKDIPPPLELECLKALWEIKEGNVRAVQAHIEPRKKLAYTTVMTLLERLAKKGAVSRRKSGRAFLYLPIAEQEALRRKAIHELTESLFEGSPDLLRKYLDSQPQAAAAAAANNNNDDRLDTSLL